MTKNKKIFFTYLFIGILAAGIGSYFRLYPLLHFTTGDTTDKATLYVINYLKTKITNQVNQNFPNLPAAQKEAIIKKQFDEIIKNDNKNVRESIDKISQNIQVVEPSHQKTPYLLESDPFYYYQLTENLIEAGKISDTIKGSKYLNKLMLAPEGHWEPLNLNPYVGLFIFKILRIFDPEISLMYAVSFTPIVISTLAIIPFLFLAYFLECSPIVSLTGVIYFLLSPIFIKRSTLGWYDNDPYNTFFPLSILAIIFYASRFKTDHKKTIGLGLLAALFTLIYALFWQGWVFIFSVILISGIIFLIYSYWGQKNKESTQWGFRFLGSLALGSFIFLSFVFGPKDFFILFKEGWVALTNFLTPQLSPWPDLYMTVGELHKITFSKMLESVGGGAFFSVGVFGILTSIGMFFWKKQKEDSLPTIFISTFFSIALFITLGAQRFALLFLVPLSLAFLLGLKNIEQWINHAVNQRTSLPAWLKRSGYFLLSALLLSLTIFPMKYLKQSTAALLNPIFNETWEKALVQIREKTPENSIINAWWPPGHFIKAIAHRRVTFDGATINFPQAYWLANALIESDETKALGIIRMLNNSANQAADYLQSLGFKLSQTIDILHNVTNMDKPHARVFLKQLLKDEQIVHLLNLTHANPPPSYLFLYSEFVDSNLQLKFIGKWNFKAIEAINADPKLFAKVPKRNSKEYIQFLWDLVGGPYQYSPKMAQISQAGPVVMFEQNFYLNTDTMDCYILSENKHKKIQHSIFYLDGDHVEEKKLADSNLPYSVIILKEYEKYSAIMLDPKLARSILVQLYFFDGKGLKYFKPFVDESDLTGRTKIKVFEVDWERFNSSFK